MAARNQRDAGVGFPIRQDLLLENRPELVRELQGGGRVF
jgi:hypothetical protein